MELELDRARSLIERHARRALAGLPPGCRRWDAHTHLGLDEDGFSQTPEELRAAMRPFGVERAFSFPFNDPERSPAYRVPNDRVLRWAQESEGALVAFCRLDMADQPLAEATRCLDLGARGIKLHPRAQGFGFGERGLDPVFKLAAERRVPILVHAGRGLPAIADDLLRVVSRHPEAQLILAHAAISDLERLVTTLADVPNVCYDTSVWSSTDLRALLAGAAPEQILWATDRPYGSIDVSLVQVTSILRTTGAGEARVRAIFWDNAARVAEGRPAPRLSPPLGRPTMERPLQRLRIHEYLVMAATLLWLRAEDIPGALGLAQRACDSGRDDGLEEVAELLAAAAESWRHLGACEDDADRMRCARATLRLVQLANVLTLDG